MIKRHKIDKEKVLYRSNYQLKIDLVKRSLNKLKNGDVILLNYTKDVLLDIIRSEIINERDEYLYTAVKYYIEIGLAHFERCLSSTSEIQIEIMGTCYTVEKEKSLNGYSATEWVNLMCWAFVLKEDDYIDRISNFKIWEDLEFDSKFHLLFANYIYAYLKKEEDERKRLLTLIKADSESDIGLFRGQKESKYVFVKGKSKIVKNLFLPYATLMEEVILNNSEQFNSKLFEFLNAKRDFITKSNRKILPLFWIDFNLLGICAIAHKQGIECKVESEYIPSWIYKNEFEKSDFIF